MMGAIHHVFGPALRLLDLWGTAYEGARYDGEPGLLSVGIGLHVRTPFLHALGPGTVLDLFIYFILFLSFCSVQLSLSFFGPVPIFFHSVQSIGR